MSFNLRLSPTLESRARARSDDLGISLNAIISVALDAYLNASPAGNSVGVSQSLVVEKPAKVTPKKSTAAKPPGVGSTKKERQEYTAATRAQRKLAL